MNKVITTLSILIFSTLVLKGQSYSSISALFEESYKNEQQGDYEEAISDLTSIYKEDFYEVNLRLGWLHYLNNDQVKSKEYYQKAVAIRPESVEAKLGLIYPVSQMGEWADVIEIYEELVVMVPNNTLIRYNLAFVQHKYFKKYKEALENAKVVVKLFPFDYDGNMLMGKIYRSLGKIQEAKKHFVTANYIDPITGDAMKALQGL